MTPEQAEEIVSELEQFVSAIAYANSEGLDGDYRGARNRSESRRTGRERLKEALIRILSEPKTPSA